MKTQAATLKNEVSGACALPAEPLLSIRLLLPETGLGELFLLGKRLRAYHAYSSCANVWNWPCVTVALMEA